MVDALTDQTEPPAPTASRAAWWRTDVALIGSFALAKILVHLPVLTRYGWHHDEFYYVAAGRRPAAGYVDINPVTPFVARFVDEIAPRSLAALRIVTVLGGAAIVAVTGVYAKLLGGRRPTMVLALLAALCSPGLLSTNWLFQTVTFDQLAWVATILFVLLLLRTGDQRWWLAVGAGVGFGLETKHTMGVLAICIVLGLLFTPQRRLLRGWWPWIGAGIALLVFVPNLIWQVQHDWPTLEFLSAQNTSNREDAFFGLYPLMALFQMGPVGAFLAVTGTIWLFRQERFRPIGWLSVLVMATFTIAGGKPYYFVPMHPILLGAGSVGWCAAVTSMRSSRFTWGWVSVVLNGLVGLVIAIPVLSPQAAADADVITEIRDDFIATMGWDELVDRVVTTYNGLPASERAKTAIVTSPYGEAAALEQFGMPRGLPQPAATQNAYWMWGPPEGEASTVIAVGPRDWRLWQHCGDVEFLGKMTNEYAAENLLSEFELGVCRDLDTPIAELWPSLQHYE